MQDEYRNLMGRPYPCKQCGQLLKETDSPNRRYCLECAKLRHRIAARVSRRNLYHSRKGQNAG